VSPALSHQLTEHEAHLADLAMGELVLWHAQHLDPPTALVFHPDDLTERMDTEGVTLWGYEVRHSEDVERGNVEVVRD
jgi:hypothetical protein